jgi:hypothetical protein
MTTEYANKTHAKRIVSRSYSELVKVLGSMVYGLNGIGKSPKHGLEYRQTALLAIRSKLFS